VIFHRCRGNSFRLTLRLYLRARARGTSYSRDLKLRNSPSPASPSSLCMHARVPAIPVKGARCNFEGKSGFGGRAEARSHRLSSARIFSWLRLVNILSSPAETFARVLRTIIPPRFSSLILPHPPCRSCCHDGIAPVRAHFNCARHCAISR